MKLSNHVPCQGRNGVDMLHEQPGANLFVNRNMMSGLYATLLFEPSITFDLTPETPVVPDVAFAQRLQ